MNDGELYARFCCSQRHHARRLLREAWPALAWPAAEAPAAVLDVGCGAGDVTAELLLPRLPPQLRVVACDSSRDMLRVARRRFRRLCRLRFEQLDIATDCIRDSAVWASGPYCKVFSFFCLHWVPNQRLAVGNIHKLLSAKGEAVLLLVSNCPLLDLYEEFSKNSRWSPYMSDVNQFVSPYHHCKDPAGKFRSLLQESGFSIKFCREETSDGLFQREEDAIGTVKAINPFISRIPEDLREEYFADIVRGSYRIGALLKEENVDTGCPVYRFKYKCLMAHALKT